MRVIDVGAAPGGWSQVIAEKVESQPGQETVVAVDLLEMVPVSPFLSKLLGERSQVHPRQH